MFGMSPFSQWPLWLQYAVMVPHGLLAGFAVWIWWPKSDKEWHKFGLVAGYLIIFYLVMHFVFHF
jgi:hypothetical protein